MVYTEGMSTDTRPAHRFNPHGLLAVVPHRARKAGPHRDKRKRRNRTRAAQHRNAVRYSREAG